VKMIAVLRRNKVGSSLQPGHQSGLNAPNLQHTASQERHDQCGKQHHSSNKNIETKGEKKRII